MKRKWKDWLKALVEQLRTDLLETQKEKLAAVLHDVRHFLMSTLWELWKVICICVAE
jgi:hypothetical protein